MRTRLASTFVAVSVVALVAGLALRSWPLILLCLPPLVFLALGTLDAPGPPHLTGARTLSAGRMFVGSEVEVRLRVVNEGATLGLLEIVDELPAEFALVQGTNHTLVSLAPGEAFDLVYSVRPSLKGDFRIGPLRARSLDPLGLSAVDAVPLSSSAVVVAPAMESLARVQLEPRRTRMWVGYVPSRQIGAGSDFWGIREYLSGDGVRRINWKASARLDRLFSNEYQGERSGDVVILLDARRESEVGTPTLNTVELGVRAALGIAEHVLASKNRVGLIVQRNVLDWVPPAFGRKQLYRIVDHLIHVRAGGEWPLAYVTWVLTRYFPQDALVVLISPLTDPTFLEGVLHLVARGYDVTVVSPSPLDIEREFLDASDSKDTAYRILLMERKNLVARLRRVAQVIDWDPQTPLALSLRRLRVWPRPG